MNNKAILNVAYPFAEVSKSTVGGAEQVLFAIDCSLCNSNMQSFVCAIKGSKVNGKLIEFEYINDYNDIDAKDNFYNNLRTVIKQFINNSRVDLIHFHGIDFNQYIPETDIPVLVTLHLPIEWYSKESFQYSKVFYNCVSEYQFKKCKNQINNLTWIENGVLIPPDKPLKNKKKYALSMGRICPEKGYHLAISASKKAGVPFVLAGKVFPYLEHLIYYRKLIEPKIENKECLFLHQIGPEKKRFLFRSACCLLIPSLVEETSSLVAMEALVNGVPVIGFKAGALNDIIENGKNGFLVNDENEMAEAIKEVNRLDPSIFYINAREKYSVKRMTSQYQNLYEKILHGNTEN